MEAARRLNSILGITRLRRVSAKITQGSNPQFADRGLPCVNGKNIYFGTMLQGEPNYVSAKEFERLSGYALRLNDLVITLKHATKVGRVWIVEDNGESDFLAQCWSDKAASSLANSAFSALALSLDQGWSIADRQVRHRWNHRSNYAACERTAKCTNSANLRHRTTKNRTPFFHSLADTLPLQFLTTESARGLLEAKLGLDELTFQRPMGYATSFSNLEDAHRSDAQHYQPRFKQLIDHISKFPSRRLRIFARITGEAFSLSTYSMVGSMWSIASIWDLSISITKV